MYGALCACFVWLLHVNPGAKIIIRLLLRQGNGMPLVVMTWKFLTRTVFLFLV